MDLVSVYVFVISACGVVRQSQTFNIDVRSAKVFKGDQGTGFGLTAEFIRQSNGVTSLLVGAPHVTVKSRDTSGIHYYCDLSTRNPSCNRRISPPQREVIIRDGKYGEQEELFGMALTMANESLAVVCGPMWSDLKWWNQNYDFNVGRCQVLPAQGEQEGVTPYKHFKQYIKDIELEGRVTRHMYYGRAEFGFSADSDGEGRVVIGSPGFSVSRGGVVVLDTRFRNYTIMKEILDPEPDVVLGYAVAVGKFCGPERFCFAASNRQVQGKVYLLEFIAPAVSPLWFTKQQEYSSFGSALSAVDVSGDGWADLLVGAPTYTVYGNDTRAYDQGRVFVYISQGEVFPGQDNFHDGTTLTGDEISFSGFGSAISSIGDINRDSINDIAVGAPLEEDGAGAVYIYLGSRDGPANRYSQKIRGRDFSPPLTSFGAHISKPTSAVSDYHYPDFAVGAPLSSAAVFLKTRLIVNAHINVEATPNPVDKTNTLCPAHLARTESGCVDVTLCLNFTYSTTGLSSSAAAQFHSLVFNVALEVDQLINADVARRVRLYNSEDGTSTTSMHMGLTVTRTSPLCLTYPAILKTEYQCCQPGHSNSHRRASQEPWTLRDTQRAKEIKQMSEEGLETIDQCGLPGKYKDQINRNPFLPVQIAASFHLNTTSFGDIAPILNQSMPNSATHQLAFTNECGDDQKCYADLVLTGNVLYVPPSDVRYPFNVINETTQVELVLHVLNRGETSFGLDLVVTLTGQMDFWTPTGNTTMLCDDLQDSVLHCQGWSPLGQHEAVLIRLKFLADSVPLVPENRRVTFDVKVMPPNSRVNPELDAEDNVKRLESRTAIVADVRLNGSSTPSVSYLSDSNQADVSLTHKLLVINRGPSFLPPTVLNLTLPFQDGTASPLLLSANVTIKQPGGAIVECPQLLTTGSVIGTTDQSISSTTTSTTTPSNNGGGSGNTTTGGSGGSSTTDDPFGGGPDISPSKRRRRREAGDDPRSSPPAAQSGGDDRTLRLDCGSYQCRTYQCQLTTLQVQQRAEVNVTFTLRRAAIIFPGNVDNLLYVTTTSVAQPDLALFYPWEQPREREVVTHIKRDSKGDEINIWYIIGGVLGALLLLVIIVLVAWRCGFFKRKDKAKLKKLKRQSGFYESNRSMKRKSQRVPSAGSAPEKE